MYPTRGRKPPEADGRTAGDPLRRSPSRQPQRGSAELARRAPPLIESIGAEGRPLAATLSLFPDKLYASPDHVRGSWLLEARGR